MSTQDKVDDYNNIMSFDDERIFKKRRIISKQTSTETFKQNLDDKVQVFSSQGLKMKLGTCYVPKDNELKPLGEDACFICYEEQTLGVADGVGGWVDMGVDAGEYARQLMANAIVAVHKEHMFKGSVDLGKVLHEAYFRTKVEGSSTACIVTLKADILHAVNVGDSGFMVFRDAKLVYQSPIQQRDFNYPYQLGNSKTSDGPDMAMELFVRVKAGDIVVLGTDGLFDNMYPTEMEEILKRETKKREGSICPEKLASLIAGYALYNSFDKFALSPFAKAAKKAGFNYIGGKEDDITVVVGIIQNQEADLK
ncbi:probable protein phosphatase 2C 55 [Herrania umbratica]|uniref:Protein phosphatase n=1 Tax=Herrania umbratica TaxID=108875 RepID=A0A6J1AJL6_9ROSI|nr:probable protein phosphatase 2C 55 [Herrania umbratica]